MRLPAPGGPYLAIVPGGRVPSGPIKPCSRGDSQKDSLHAEWLGGSKNRGSRGPLSAPPGSAGGGSAYPSAERLTDCPSSGDGTSGRVPVVEPIHKCPLGEGSWFCRLAAICRPPIGGRPTAARKGTAVILNKDPTAMNRIPAKIPPDRAPNKVISYPVKISAN